MIGETLAERWTGIRYAAFEAAYVEMPNPDPTGSRFAALVRRHEQRLWAEYWAQHHGHRSAVQNDGERASVPQ